MADLPVTARGAPDWSGIEAAGLRAGRGHRHLLRISVHVVAMNYVSRCRAPDTFRKPRYNFFCSGAPDGDGLDPWSARYADMLWYGFALGHRTHQLNDLANLGRALFLQRQGNSEA